LELYKALSDVDRTAVPFIPTGYRPIDEHLLGIPSVGITLLFGPRKSGKTSLALQIAGSFVKLHQDKKVAFHSMEMLDGYLASRLDAVLKLEERDQKRLLVRDQMESPEEVINRASTIEDLGLIIIDFADLMIRGETTESSMGEIYRVLSAGAKLLRLPIILLAHPNRTYQGGIPRPEQVRWTGLASNLSEMILATYNPEQNMSYAYDKEDDKLLTPVPGTSFIIVWEIRSGFRVHEEDSPGAIQIPFKGNKGWHPTSCRWMQIKE
jgi:replicative DNA helicase